MVETMEFQILEVVELIDSHPAAIYETTKLKKLVTAE